MPGTPDPVIGSDPLTGVIAALLSVFVVGIFVYASARWDTSAVILAGVGAAGYGIFAAGLWASVRLVFYHFALDPTAEPLQFAWLMGIAGGLLAVQAVIEVSIPESLNRGIQNQKCGRNECSEEHLTKH